MIGVSESGGSKYKFGDRVLVIETSRTSSTSRLKTTCYKEGE